MPARIAAVVAVLALLAVPPFLSPYAVHTLVLVLFYAYLGTAWNVLGGYAGQFSFGHAAFFGIGAYTSTLLLVRLGVSPWIGLVAGGLLAAAFGCFAGYLSFRYGLRGPYFALVTLAFAEMLRLIAVNWMAIGGPMGILMPLSQDGRLALAAPVPGEAAVLLRRARPRRGGAVARAGHRAIAPRPPAGRDPRERGRRRGVRRRHALGQARRDGRLRLPDRRRGHVLRPVLHLHRPRRSCSARRCRSRSSCARSWADRGRSSGPLLGSIVLTPLSEVTRALIRGRPGVDVMVYGALLVVVITFLPGGLAGAWRRVFRTLGSWRPRQA